MFDDRLDCAPTFPTASNNNAFDTPTNDCSNMKLLIHSLACVATALTLTVTPPATFAEDAADNVDPWQPLNRKVHGFNNFADRILLKPIAKGYSVVVPKPLQRGFRNLFRNLGEPATSINQVLQGKPGRGASDFGRFLINSTVGLGGLFDPAAGLGLERHQEDFGQTFARWGIARGPYLVVPLRGPASVRAAGGMVLDTFLNPLRFVNDVPVRNSLVALSTIDVRAELLSTESLLSGDEYLFIRDAYLQRRDFLISDGAIEEDPFLDDFDDEAF